ncbi:MAG TPA: hypothetical protein VGJ04_10965 [Pirellulales bacterium]|jgi:uncharacterized membrane protein
MRPYSLGGLILVILGVVLLSIHSFTYFSTDHVVGPLGYFAWDVSQPHTIFMNPIAGMLAIVLGIVLLVMTRRRTPA